MADTDAPTLPDALASGNNLDAIAKQAQASIAKTTADLNKAQALSDEAYKGIEQETKTSRERFDELMRNNPHEKYKEYPIKPWDKTPPEVDPMRSFGSIASVAGILASAFTRQPIAGALNSSAAAMSALRQNDLMKYQEEKEKFKLNTEIAEKGLDWELKGFQSALETLKTDHALGVQQWMAVANRAGNDQALAIARANEWGKAGELALALQRARVEFPIKAAELEKLGNQRAAVALRDQQWMQDPANKDKVLTGKDGTPHVPPEVHLQHEAEVATLSDPERSAALQTHQMALDSAKLKDDEYLSDPNSKKVFNPKTNQAEVPADIKALHYGQALQDLKNYSKFDDVQKARLVYLRDAFVKADQDVRSAQAIDPSPKSARNRALAAAREKAQQDWETYLNKIDGEVQKRVSPKNEGETSNSSFTGREVTIPENIKSHFVNPKEKYKVGDVFDYAIDPEDLSKGVLKKKITGISASGEPTVGPP